MANALVIGLETDQVKEYDWPDPWSLVSYGPTCISFGIKSCEEIMRFEAVPDSGGQIETSLKAWGLALDLGMLRCAPPGQLSFALRRRTLHEAGDDKRIAVRRAD